MLWKAVSTLLCVVSKPQPQKVVLPPKNWLSVNICETQSLNIVAAFWITVLICVSLNEAISSDIIVIAGASD